MTALPLASLKALREPFPSSKVGKRPVSSCKACSDAPRGQACAKQGHRMARCRECGNWITTAHTHLDFVGHAHVTERLLDVDSQWSWEPLAFDQHGLPAVDGNGGMWIRLTVAGVTRLGYGDAQGKKGPNAVKEVIGDAIRNAAMRFGVALDLWSKERDDYIEQAGKPTPQQDKADPRQALWADIAKRGEAVVMTEQQMRDDFAAWSTGDKTIDGADTTAADLTTYFHQMPKPKEET